MDDPLRPKSVPLAAETILWFEFLLDSNLLVTHLSKPNPTPAPIELINQFLSMSPDQSILQLDIAAPTISETESPTTPGSMKTESFRVGRKQLALKILSLKVGTYLKWNLGILEKNLSIPKQMCLLKDLLCVSFGMFVSVPLNEDMMLQVYPEGSEKAAKFAYTLYHRWVLRLQLIKDIAVKASRPNIIDPLQQAFAPDITTGISIHFLKQLCQSDDPFHILTYDTFTSPHPNTDFSVQNFDDMKEIPLSEVKAQVYFDFTNYFLYSKQYKKARDAVIKCRDNLIEFKKLNEKFMYCNVSETELNGLLTACGVSGKEVTLTEKFNIALLNQYEGIVEVLKEDNKIRELPVVNRRVLELDVEGSISVGLLRKPKEFLMSISALNVIRSVFDEENLFTPVDYFQKFKNLDCFTALFEGIVDILPHCSISEKLRIKSYLIDIVIRYECNNLMPDLSTTGLFSSTEIEDFKRQNQSPEIFVPALATITNWKCSSKLQRIDIGSLERQLISCANPILVRKLLVKLASSNLGKPLWQVNPSWQIPIQLNSVIMSLQRGFLQDFAYVLLGKAREMTSKNDFVGAVSMLSSLKSETQRADISNTSSIVKLGKLVTWEILLIQICQSLFEWNNKSLDMQSLSAKCKQCLATLQNGDNLIPRIEIIEHCAVVLVNVNDWNSLMILDKRIVQLDLPISIATTFLEMEKLKGSKKCIRDPWDLILPMFNNSTNKRTNSSRNSPSLSVQNNLQSFLKRIRDQTVLSLLISLLAKIHNILKDDQHFDLNGEYMHLWPTSISNPIGYNIKAVAEILNWLLDEGLQYYPYNICWMRMKGDLELANGNNEAAMKNYINTILTGTENFTLPLHKTILDDYIVRKMIKCATNMNCYMQAVILCQFLDEIDYAVASKNLTEKWPNFMDAIDSYYNCLWDQTLLEMIIVHHTKKNEFVRRQDATSVLWNSDINPNNNDEIKREAINLRKVRFLRSLANQYLL